MPPHAPCPFPPLQVDTSHPCLSAARSQLCDVMNHMKTVRFPDAFVTRLLPSTTCESLDEPVQCVLFDLDDTLYPVRPPLEAAHGTRRNTYSYYSK